MMTFQKWVWFWQLVQFASKGAALKSRFYSMSMQSVRSSGGNADGSFCVPATVSRVLDHSNHHPVSSSSLPFCIIPTIILYHHHHRHSLSLQPSFCIIPTKHSPLWQFNHSHLTTQIWQTIEKEHVIMPIELHLGVEFAFVLKIMPHAQCALHI